MCFESLRPIIIITNAASLLSDEDDASAKSATKSGQWADGGSSRDFAGTGGAVEWASLTEVQHGFRPQASKHLYNNMVAPPSRAAAVVGLVESLEWIPVQPT